MTSRFVPVFLLGLLVAPAYADEASSDLLVFVGQRLEVKQVVAAPPPEVIVLDREFEARYKVLSVIFGDYRGAEIEFTALERHGRPEFANHEIALLYLLRSSGWLIHRKYESQAVYRTADGRWAGCGDPYRDEPGVDRGSVRARAIEFRPQVTFSVVGLTGDEVKKRYPPEYYIRRGNVVTCMAGAYAEELFEIKRDGVLKARGVFK